MRAIAASLVLGLSLVWAEAVSAQTTYIQVEAYQTLNEAENAVREYAGAMDDLNGFRSRNGWYVVALGPFEVPRAATLLGQLLSARRIPSDAYLADASVYTNQFYPVGAESVAAPPDPTPEPSPDVAAAPPETEAATPEIVAEPAPPPPLPPEETRQQALRSESQLSRQEKFNLQIALQWFGFYSGRIDAAFGRGTRGAMSAWQRDQGYDQTGVLTSRQRLALLEAYEAVVASIGLETIADTDAGITLQIPAAMVSFDRYEPPFAHYTSINDSDVRVLLISRSGDENGLIGLYDIMQTLKIVPLEGARERRANRFTLTGENSDIKSYTYAVLDRGEIKGFTLIWPTGEDRRFDVVLEAMRDSFTPVSGTVLPDTLGDGALDQSIDLLSGLEIRRPIASRSGFFINDRGLVVTASTSLDACARVTLDEVHPAEIVASDAALGVALLRPEQPLAPIDYARFQPGIPRLQSEIAVAGYSFGGVLGAPTLTFGRLADLRGLDGEENVKRLALKANPSDVGGPVFDASGSVLGMLLPFESPAGKQLPPDVSFATNAPAIAEFLSDSGVSAAASDRATAISAEQLTRQAADLTVLVGCWGE